MDEFIGYVEHFLEMPQIIIYFLMSFLMLLLIYFVLFVYVKISSSGRRKKERKQYIRTRFHSLTERFYEIVFSGTSILLFMASYYLIERFFDVEPFKTIWNDYRDFLLLILIVISCIINTLLDSVIIRLKHVNHEDKAAGRLTGMIYMILIFCYIKFIYENNNYDVFITYFLGLMVGRFVYFDASFKDFINSIVAALKNIPLMISGLAYAGVLCLYGFASGYLIKHIGVITDTCITHLFMCVAIFILYHSHLSDLLVGKLDTKMSEKFDDEYDEYDEDYYED